jgi:hypothetical protein
MSAFPRLGVIAWRSPAPIVFASLFLLLAVRPAYGTVGPPVKVTLLGEPRAALAGEDFAGSLRILTGKEAVISGFRLEGKGWQGLSVNAPPQLRLESGKETTVEFTARCENPEDWLVVAFEWNGRTVRKHLDLSPRGVRYATEAAPMVPAERQTPYPGPSPDWRGPDPAMEEEMPTREYGPNARTIRVRGRVTYLRPDNTEIGAAGLTVRVYDDDPGVDDHIATTTTNGQGWFDHTFTFDDYWEDYPDIYFQFRAENNKVDVKHATWGYTYKWETGVTRDVSSFLDIGTVQSLDEDLVPALHILTDEVRTWVWFDGYGYDCRFVEVEWPDGDEGSWYIELSEEIHLSTESEWSEYFQTHEYGHHFINCFADLLDPDYCNGFCDPNEPWDCGHCRWCPENVGNTWNEGFPEYVGDVIPDTYLSWYGAEPEFPISAAGLDSCQEDDGFYDPLTTEGFMAACLVDIHDADNDNHDEFPEFGDPCSLGPQAILDCAAAVNPTSAMGFLLALKARHPDARYALWETAANCGYDIDEAPPEAPTVIWSTSHPEATPTPDATVSLYWFRPYDDASGAKAYSVAFPPGAPELPDAYEETEENSFESPPLAPGTYYCCVRTKDWAGNWSPDYAAYGPVIIREPEPAELEFAYPAGWDYPLVPSSVNTNTQSSTTVSATLPGGGTTYWNVAGMNSGESPTTANVIGKVYVDGQQFQGDDWGIVDAGETFYSNNRSHSGIPGGRHTAHYKLDSPEILAEPDETNNTWGHQFVWTPHLLDPGTVYTDYAPRSMSGGWEHVTDGSTLYPNCTGLRFNNEDWWNAVVVWATDNLENFDARLHFVSTGSNHGFTVPLQTSSRGPGCLDALLVNRNSVATAQYDVGVVRSGTGSAHSYKALHVVNDYASLDYPVSVSTGPDDWLKLYDFDVPSERTGQISVMVETVPPWSPVYVQWRSETWVSGGLMDCDAQTVTGADGKAHLIVNIPDSGFNGLCLFRDPKDGDTPVTINFVVTNTPPDFHPWAAPGWHSPLVPRAADDGTMTSVPLPDTLYGNANSTYYNLALMNEGPGEADSVNVYVFLDIVPDLMLIYSHFPAYASSRLNWPFPTTIRGGRHSLGMMLDPLSREAEIDEDNNIYGEQYCWSPYPLPPGTATSRGAPPGRTAGWHLITSGETMRYNCDGLRISGPGSYWNALAVTPDADTDVDIRLHRALEGAKDGFAQVLAMSAWGPEAIDFVIVNFNMTARKDYDVGVVQTTGEGGYSAHCTPEIYIPAPEGLHGPFAMPSGQIIKLYEMYLEPGGWQFILDAKLGNIDWGMSLHPADEAYISKSMVVDNGMAWLNMTGQGETFTVDIVDPGYYCLAVWKASTPDVAVSGQFTFTVNSVVTGVGDQAVGETTRLLGAVPNPLRSSSTIRFELAGEEYVAIALYDLRGRVIRRLVDEPLPAGRHDVFWDGCDEAGARVAGGVYLVRLSADEVTRSGKVVVLR